MAFGRIEETTDWYVAHGKSELTTKKVEKAIHYGA
jgi:fructose/tagatose bisphosphate aldolase